MQEQERSLCSSSSSLCLSREASGRCKGRGSVTPVFQNPPVASHHTRNTVRTPSETSKTRLCLLLCPPRSPLPLRLIFVLGSFPSHPFSDLAGVAQNAGSVHIVGCGKQCESALGLELTSANCWSSDLIFPSLDFSNCKMGPRGNVSRGAVLRN